ncbi:MAG: hypothetical protein CL947_02580 [Epsilonproteobacteria bacterium]|nr:hypothetical protein [Campylobacterota bacterium]|tara:strand:- start:6897 stop:7718 length:822 start_codon:yes stop_codon:yes gene_type:complete
MLIDTHCHLNIMIRDYAAKKEFKPLTEKETTLCQEVITAANNHNVTTIINVGTDLIESLTCIDIAKRFSNCFATIGLHPTDAHANWQTTIVEFKELLKQQTSLKIIGIGECGIDKYHKGYDAKRQRQAFQAQIELAIEHNLPIIVHSRDADIETYEILADYKNEPSLKGTIHCFSYNENYAQKFIDLGFVLGLGGTITYPKNETLRNVAKTVPLESIILETDAPFLAPQNVRGQQNSPAHIRTIAEFIANLRNEEYKTIAKITSETTNNLFNI